MQIKGHLDPNNKYINAKRITYSVDLGDLMAYATEKGVIYFQIFINDKKKEIFYSFLYPSKIADYLEKAKEKGNKSSISIVFTKLEKDADKLYCVAKQFNDEALKQGSAYMNIPGSGYHCIRRNQVAAFAAMSGHGAERVAGLK